MKNDFSHKFRSHGEEIDFISKSARGLNCGDVRIDKNCENSFFLQRLNGLRTTVIEFSGLADREPTGAKNENFAWMQTIRGDWSRWNGEGDQLACIFTFNDAGDEFVK